MATSITSIHQLSIHVTKKWFLPRLSRITICINQAKLQFSCAVFVEFTWTLCHRVKYDNSSYHGFLSPKLWQIHDFLCDSNDYFQLSRLTSSHCDSSQWVAQGSETTSERIDRLLTTTQRACSFPSLRPSQRYRTLRHCYIHAGTCISTAVILKGL